MKLNKLETFFLILIIFLSAFAVLLYFDKGLVTFLVSRIVSDQNLNVTYKFGTFTVYVYNPNNGEVKRENITGVMVTVVNQQTSGLTILSIFNSTYVLKNPLFYEEISAPLPNGSIITAYEKSSEIYIGYEEIIIPTQHLSPGQYTVSLSDGTTFEFNIP